MKIAIIGYSGSGKQQIVEAFLNSHDSAMAKAYADKAVILKNQKQLDRFCSKLTKED